MMDIATITQLINGVGFPIAACFALWYTLTVTVKDLQTTLGKINDNLDLINRRLDALESRSGDELKKSSLSS